MLSPIPKFKATGSPVPISTRSICDGWINRCSHTERTGRSLVLKPQGYSEASIAFAKISVPEHQPPERDAAGMGWGQAFTLPAKSPRLSKAKGAQVTL